MKNEKLERIVSFTPAYDKRHEDPKKNYGIHGVTLTMALKGESGAVQFVLYTNWMLPHVQEETDKCTVELIAGRAMPTTVLTSFKGYVSAFEEVQKIIDKHRNVIPYEEGMRKLSCFYHPMPADLGYHSKFPMHEGHEPMGSSKLDFDQIEEVEGTDLKLPKTIATGTFTPCEYTGGPCYYDGSTSNADPIYQVLLKEGSDGVWRELEEYYHQIFDSQESTHEKAKSQSN